MDPTISVTPRILDYNDNEKEEAEATSYSADRDTAPLGHDANSSTGEGQDETPVGDLPGAVISDADRKLMIIIINLG